MSRKGCADGNTLLLASRKVVERMIALMGYAEEIKGLFDSLAHGGGSEPELFHRVSQLFLHVFSDEGGSRVLDDDSYDIGEVAGPVGTGIAPVYSHDPRQGTPREVRNEPIDSTEERGLPHPRRPDHQCQFSLGDVQVDVSKSRFFRASVGDGDIVELDHA
jgi:hypothetical protein